MTDEEVKYKFENVTAGWVGAVVLNDDRKPHGIPVAPGSFVWLSRVEQRLTAEAPQDPRNNPFIAQWQRPTAYNTDGEPTGFETIVGQLQLSQEAPRPILTDREMPDLSRATAVLGPAAAPGHQPVGETVTPPAPDGAPEEPPEVTGAPPLPTQPPVEGQPAPHEVIATPEAPAQNDEALARAAAERETELARQAAIEDAAITGRARASKAAKTPVVV